MVRPLIPFSARSRATVVPVRLAIAARVSPAFTVIVRVPAALPERDFFGLGALNDATWALSADSCSGFVTAESPVRILSRVPRRTEGVERRFQRLMSWAVTPYLAAMLPSVSPRRTVWVIRPSASDLPSSEAGRPIFRGGTYEVETRGSPG